VTVGTRALYGAHDRAQRAPPLELRVAKRLERETVASVTMSGPHATNAREIRDADAVDVAPNARPPAASCVVRQPRAAYASSALDVALPSIVDARVPPGGEHVPSGQVHKRAQSSAPVSPTY